MIRPYYIHALFLSLAVMAQGYELRSRFNRPVKLTKPKPSVQRPVTAPAWAMEDMTRRPAYYQLRRINGQLFVYQHQRPAGQACRWVNLGRYVRPTATVRQIPEQLYFR